MLLLLSREKFIERGFMNPTGFCDSLKHFLSCGIFSESITERIIKLLHTDVLQS